MKIRFLAVIGVFTMFSMFSCGQREASVSQILSAHFALNPLDFSQNEENQIVIKENTNRVFQAIIYDSENAGIFFDKMLGEGHEYVIVSEDDDIRLKQLEIRKGVAEQKLIFAVWNRKQNNTFGYYIDMDKTDASKYYFRFSETDTKYVVRTDTDVTRPAELIYDLFPNLPRRAVEAGEDPDGKIWVNGGKEFIVPGSAIDQDVPLKLSCRGYANNGQGHFCKFLLFKKSVPPVIQSGEKIELHEALTYSKVVLKDSNAAKLFYEQLSLPETTSQDRTVKSFLTQQDPGQQQFRLSCWKSQDVTFGCDVLIEKRTDTRTYKVHDAKNDKTIQVMRNDTDYAEAGKVIFNLFPKLPRKTVKAENDPQIGYQIPGGEEFTVGDDTSMKLVCRYQKATDEGEEKGFCKFVVKKP